MQVNIPYMDPFPLASSGKRFPSVKPALLCLFLEVSSLLNTCWFSGHSARICNLPPFFAEESKKCTPIFLMLQWKMTRLTKETIFCGESLVVFSSDQGFSRSVVVILVLEVLRKADFQKQRISYEHQGSTSRVTKTLKQLKLCEALRWKARYLFSFPPSYPEKTS